MTGKRLLSSATRGAIALALAIFAGWFAAPRSAAADSPALATAQGLYDSGEFTAAIDSLKSALKSARISGGEIVLARELLARAQVRAGKRVEARATFLALLQEDPAYRADELRMPTDEIEVYHLARQAYDARQAELARRTPASIAINLGYGKHTNSGLNAIKDLYGGDGDEGGTEYGGSVRFPVSPRWSLDFEVVNLEAKDEYPTASVLGVEHFAQPVVLSGYWNWLGHGDTRLNLFVGAGPMESEWRQKIILIFAPANVSDTKMGFYSHGGVEVERRLGSRLAVNGRLLGRYASSGRLNFGNPGAGLQINGRAVDFRGIAFSAGLRAYIGY